MGDFKKQNSAMSGLLNIPLQRGGLKLHRNEWIIKKKHK